MWEGPTGTGLALSSLVEHRGPSRGEAKRERKRVSKEEKENSKIKNKK
jgi:hypothetical protein